MNYCNTFSRSIAGLLVFGALLPVSFATQKGYPPLTDEGVLIEGVLPEAESALAELHGGVPCESSPPQKRLPHPCKANQVDLTLELENDALDQQDRDVIENWRLFLKDQIKSGARCYNAELFEDLWRVQASMWKQGWFCSFNDVLNLIKRIREKKGAWQAKALKTNQAVFAQIPLPAPGVKGNFADVYIKPDGEIIIRYKNEVLGSGTSKQAESIYTLAPNRRGRVQKVEPKVALIEKESKLPIVKKEMADYEAIQELGKEFPSKAASSEEISRQFAAINAMLAKAKRKGIEYSSPFEMVLHELRSATAPAWKRKILNEVGAALAVLHSDNLEFRTEIEKEMKIYQEIEAYKKKLPPGQKLVGLAEAEFVNLGDREHLMIQHRYVSDLSKALPELQANFSKRVGVLQEVAEGLNHLHKMGKVHGDFKDPNIFMDQDGHPKIADFGLTTDPTVSVNSRTSAAYEAPEMVDQDLKEKLRRSDDAKLIQARDTYGFGILMLTTSGRQSLRPYNQCRESFQSYDTWEGKVVGEGENKKQLPHYGECIKAAAQKLYDSTITNAMNTCARPLLQCLEFVMARCLSPSPKDRPTMDEVASQMKHIK